MAYQAGFLIIPIIILLALIILIWLGTAFAIHLVARRWRRIISIFVGPPIAFIFVLALSRAGYDLTWLRFEARKEEYMRELAQYPSYEPRMKQWHWGDRGFAITASSTYTIVFDESDEIALPPEHRSNGWRLRADRADVTSLLQAEYLRSIRKLSGHFYLVQQWFQ